MAAGCGTVSRNCSLTTLGAASGEASVRLRTVIHVNVMCIKKGRQPEGAAKFREETSKKGSNKVAARADIAPHNGFNNLIP